MKTLLITGANRGLGLEFARQYLDAGHNVIATCRAPENALALHALSSQFETLQIFQLDVCDSASRSQLHEDIRDIPIDCFISNAGIYGDAGEKIETLTECNLSRVMMTNAFAPLLLIQILLPLMMRGADKLIVSVTSRMGSIGDNDTGGHYSYRASKSALNMLMKSLAIELSEEGIHILSLHPGWVKTDMGGEKAPEIPEDSVSKMRSLIDCFKQYESGGFFHADGYALPW